jgi:lysophospholipase L1-like esterase
MLLEEFINYNTKEKPLDNLKENGGYTAIFRTICCVGDSLSSGEFEYVNDKNEKFYFDKFEYSWGQFIQRMINNKVYNFSRGGMTAKEYMESFADLNNFWDPMKKGDCYIIALGVNDLLNMNLPLGSISDIDIKNYKNNKDTFCGWYARIIQRYKEINPTARFFFVTMPKENVENDKLKEKHKNLLYELANLFKYSYVIDLYTYAPIYDNDFKEKFFLESHMNPAGYYLTAVMISSYIDYIIRTNFKDFKQVGFIGAKEYREELD